MLISCCKIVRPHDIKWEGLHTEDCVPDLWAHSARGPPVTDTSVTYRKIVFVHETRELLCSSAQATTRSDGPDTENALKHRAPSHRHHHKSA